MTLQRFIERLIWLCMLPLIILGAVLLVLHLLTLNERRQMLADSVVRTAARSLDQMLEVRLASLQLLGRMLDEGLAMRGATLDPKRAHRIARQYVDLYGHHVIIGNERYEMLLNTRVPPGEPLPPLPKVEGQSAMAMAITSNTPAVGDPFQGPVTGREMVAMTVPLNLQMGDRLVLVSTLEMEQLLERIQSFRLPEGWQIRVFDSRGREMTSGRGVTRSVLPGIADALASPDSGAWRQASLANAPWTVGLTAPAASIFDHPLMQALLLIGTLSATVGVAYWGGHIAARRLTESMASLMPAGPPVKQRQDIEEVAMVRTELRRLSRRREALQEAERRRIGLELHDDLQQKLALVRHDIDGLLAEDGTLKEMRSATELERLHRARKLVDETIDATRRMVQDLRPPALSDLGLPTALQALAASHQLAHAQVVDVRIAESDRLASLGEEIALALYRVAQEALNNARKHSKANRIDVALDISANGEVVMEVSDDGQGFNPSELDVSSTGNGLRGMRERVQALGGSLGIISHPGEGTALLARIPLSVNTPHSPPAPPAIPGLVF